MVPASLLHTRVHMCTHAQHPARYPVQAVPCHRKAGEAARQQALSRAPNKRRWGGGGWGALAARVVGEGCEGCGSEPNRPPAATASAFSHL
jgi:hypothetical protein